MAGEDKTTIETDVEIKVKSDELKKLQADFKNLNKEIAISNDRISNLTTSLEKLKSKQQYMTKNAYSAEYSKLSSSLGNEKTKLNENKELASLYKDEIKKIKAEIASLENTEKANKENAEATKKNTNAKKKETKATEDSAKAEEKKAKETARATRLERDSQTKRMNAESSQMRAQAALLAAQAKQDAVNKRYEFQSRKRSGRYQAGRGLYSAGSYLGKNLSSPTGNILGTSFQILGTAFMNPAMGFAVAIQQAIKGLTQFAKASVEAYGQIESIKTQLGVVFGSNVQSDEAFNQLAEYAVKSPFGVSQTAELATLLKQSGVYATDLMDTLKMLGDTAGGNMEKMKRIANNYAQIVSIGKASMLDMRQFAYAGIPIFEKVSEELGVSQQRLRKLISDGKVTADVIQRVFKNMTGPDGIFENATAKGAQTFQARLQNLKDTKQLALAEVGQSFMNKGTSGTNDGYIMNGMTIAETMYQKLKNWSAINNIERSVKNIEDRDSKVGQLKDLIEYNKSIGNKKEAERLEKQLKEIAAEIDPEKDRATLANAFEERQKRELEYAPLVTGNADVDMGNLSTQRRLAGMALPVSAIETFVLKGISGGISTFNKVLTGKYEDNTYWGKWAEQNEQNMKNFWNDFWLYGDVKKYVNDGYSATKEMSQADADKYTELTQRAMGDYIKSTQESETSAFRISQEIIEAYEKTDEYKEKQQAETLKKWKETQALLKEISDHTDKNDKLDYKNLLPVQFINYLKSGALTGRQLATTGDNPKLLTQDRSALNNSIMYGAETIRGKYVSGLSRYGVDISKIESKLDKIEKLTVSPLSDKEFIESFNRMYKDLGSEIETLEKANTPFEKQFFEEMRTFFKSMTYEYSANTEGKDVDLNALAEGTGKVFVPLWKRILGSATGISPNVMSSTRETLDWYSNDMAVRNITSGVLGAALRNGGNVNTVQSLLKTSGVLKELKNAGSGTYQIDWEATGKAISKFATNLGTANEVLEAYRKGLEDELDTYVNLLSNGLTQTETQDLTSGKMISAKRYAELEKEYGGFFVNAFGEKLFSDKGLEVTVKDGQFVDSQGNIVAQENVKISGNIYTLLQDKLTDLQKRIATAKLQEENNKIYEKYAKSFNLSKVQDLLLMRTTQSLAGVKAGQFIIDEPEYIQSQFSNLYAEKMNGSGDKYDDSWTSEEGLMSQYMSGNPLAEEFVDALLKEILINIYNVQNRINGGTSGLQATSNKDKEFANSIQQTNSGLSGPFNKQGTGSTWADFQHALYGKSVLSDAGYGDDKNIQQLMKDYPNIINEANVAQQAFNNTLKETSENLINIGKQTSQDMFLSPFKTLGEDMVSMVDGTKDWSDYLTDAKQGMRQIAAEMTSNIGNELITCGLRIAAAGALEGKAGWGKVALGLGLAATGGLAAGLGSALNNAQDKSNDDKEIDKLESLKDQMAKLLEQARSDALYYENNLRHKTALGTNEKFSYQSVNDMILTPHGNFSTAPDDYIIATKQPQALGTSKGPQVVTVQPVINPIVYNNSQAQVRQEQLVNDDGSIDVITYIEDAIADFIASPKGDEAFAARQARIYGRHSVM